jgi:hypothetical protein
MLNTASHQLASEVVLMDSGASLNVRQMPPLDTIKIFIGGLNASNSFRESFLIRFFR